MYSFQLSLMDKRRLYLCGTDRWHYCHHKYTMSCRRSNSTTFRVRVYSRVVSTKAFILKLHTSKIFDKRNNKCQTTNRGKSEAQASIPTVAIRTAVMNAILLTVDGVWGHVFQIPLTWYVSRASAVQVIFQVSHWSNRGP